MLLVSLVSPVYPPPRRLPPPVSQPPNETAEALRTYRLGGHTPAQFSTPIYKSRDWSPCWHLKLPSCRLSRVPQTENSNLVGGDIQLRSGMGVLALVTTAAAANGWTIGIIHKIDRNQDNKDECLQPP